MAARRVNRLEDALESAARHLDELGRHWALVGGLAVSARAEPRTTRDVDVAVEVAGDHDAESVIFALRGAGYAIEATVEHRTMGRLATARLRPAGGSPVLLDLLFASTGIEAEIVRGASRIDVLPQLSVPVASVGHLIAMKLLARDDRSRPQDSDDLRHLLVEATETDLADARAAAGLIAERGFARGRDLQRLLELLIEQRA